MEKHEINYFLTHFGKLKDPETGLLRFHKAGDKSFLHYVMRANNRMINVCSIWGYGGYDDCYFPADEYFQVLEIDIYNEKEYEIYTGGHK